MSRSAYGWQECPVCGKYISLNGMGAASHFKKHCREGLMIDTRKADRFQLTEESIAIRRRRLIRTVEASVGKRMI